MYIGGYSSGDTGFTYRSEDEGISARVADALNDNDIFDLVKILHMSTTGSGDPLSTAELLLVTARLQTRLQHWRAPSSEYDEHVRRLVGAAVRESLQRVAQRAQQERIIG